MSPVDGVPGLITGQTYENPGDKAKKELAYTLHNQL
jgi:hypothetical protein